MNTRTVANWVVNRIWSVSIIITLLLAIYVVLGRQAMLLLPDYKEELEAWLSDKAGVPISVESVEGKWHVYRPAVMLRGVRVNANHTDSHVFPRLDYARVQLNLLASLAMQSPRLGDFEMSGFKVTVKRQKGGAIEVVGLPTMEKLAQLGNASGAGVKSTNAARSPEPSRTLPHHRHARARSALDTLMQQKSLLLSDVHIDFYEGDQLWQLYSREFHISKEELEYKISARLELKDEQQPLHLELIAYLIGSPKYTDKIKSDFYIKIPPVDISRWVAGKTVSGYRVKALTGATQLWGQVAFNRMIWAKGDVAIDNMVLENAASETVAIDRLSARVDWQRLAKR